MPLFDYNSSWLSGRLGSLLNAQEADPQAASTGFDWGNLALGLAVSSAVTDAIGGYSSARLKAGQLDLQSSNAAASAKMAELGAQQALYAGESQIAQITRRAGQLKAQQRAGYAASGVAVGVGNSAEVMASTDVMKEIDAKTAKINALQAAWGYRRQAMMLDAQSKAADIMADANRSVAPLQGFNSLLSGATKVAGLYYGMGRY